MSITEVNLDSGTDSPRSARSQILESVQLLNNTESFVSADYSNTNFAFAVHSTALRGSILRHIPRSEWAAILNYTSTFDCTTAIGNWITETSNGGYCGTMPDGKFIWNGGIISDENVRIKGSSRPRLNSTRNALVGGSIIVGTFRLNGEQVELENIGIDHGLTNTGSAGDGLVISASGTGVYARLQNVIGLGRSADDAYHAILVEGYETVDIDNIFGCRTWYGNALKLKKANVSRVRGYENAIAGCILRSNSGDGICEDININDVLTVGRGRAASGSGGTDYGFYIVVDNQAARINVSNVNARSAKQTVGVRVNANLTELNMTNIVASACESGVTFFTGAGSLYSTQMSNVTAVECSAWALHVEKAVSLQVNGFHGMGESGTAYLDELIRIESAVNNTMMDNIKLTENYSNGAFGSIRYLNGNAENRLGTNLWCKVKGNTPWPGYFTSTATGATVTLQPDYTANGRIVIVSTRSGVVATVTNIGREYSPGPTRFAPGVILIVKNDDSSNLTISSTATNVVTKSGVNIVIAPSNVAVFVFDGAFWVEA